MPGLGRRCRRHIVEMLLQEVSQLRIIEVGGHNRQHALIESQTGPTVNFPAEHLTPALRRRDRPVVFMMWNSDGI
ncbi:hypothetical protein KACC15558_15660 [Brevibacterium ammoniilyticum]|uniref:Uncharacterized protein n=1 Tax=Brevibacterium ammoniilyticum TaxID=1046555 RepID=A0ABP9U0R0_9MICO